MKKENGVTLTSIIIYIIALLIVIGVVSALTSYFYKNVDVDGESKLTNSQFTKFTSFFTNEINEPGIKVIEKGENENVNYITFSNKQTYTFSKQNNAIYLNEMKICDKIDRCIFDYTNENGKFKITVDFASGTFSRVTTYNTKI